KSKHKIVRGKKINKTIIANADDQEINRLKKYKVDNFVSYGVDNPADYQAKDINLDEGLFFTANNFLVRTKFLGKFNVYNILASLAIVEELNFDLAKAAKCQLRGVPGRQEWIDPPAGGGQDFKIMVDYAPEPESLKYLYKALESINKNKLIHVLGSCGGGRDKARQPILGKMAGENADIIIVTNEDPYDDDPQEIIDNVAKGVLDTDKIEGKDLFKVADRQKGIEKAMELAKSGDLVLVTGKGAEQYICGPNGQMIAHDDRQVIKDLLK
ncbi:hypothetical protein K8R42_02885, partial [bacterium]|nr:hypothetical protein [bacterium]